MSAHPVPDAPTSVVLEEAARFIEERGWVQGDWGALSDAESPMCLEGGICAAMGIDFGDPNWAEPLLECSAYKAVEKRVGCQPYAWNDSGIRTKGQVVSLLREVAETERAKELALSC